MVNLSAQFDCDVAIAGGGIVGTTLASALKSSGLKVVIIEKQTLEGAAARRQAYALSILSGRILRGIGVWDKILPNIAQFSQIRLSDAHSTAIVPFNLEELGTESLGYVGEHGVILTALQNFLKNSPNVQWLCPAEVLEVVQEEKGVNVRLQIGNEEKTIRTPLIVAADGSRSPLRAWAKINTKGWKYWQSCLTFTIRHQKLENETAYECFHPSGPMGVLPLPGNRCQIVWSAPHTEAQALQKLDQKEFLARLEKRLGPVFGKLELLGERWLFPVQLMQCDRYSQARLALVGDAAHCCHPVGGQGLNLGIRDAAVLAQILLAAQGKGEDLGDEKILQEYDRCRRRENWLILAFTDFLNRLFSNQWYPLVRVRRLGLWLLRLNQPLKLFALQLMTGLKGEIPQLAQE